MRVLSALPQHDLYARAGDGDEALLPPDLVQDIRRIPSPFKVHLTTF